MTPVNLQPAANNKKFRRSKTNLRIDMTPMVDLGFLLITFFIFTTTMAESKATDLFMPKEGSPTDVADSKSLTVILSGRDRVFVYNGEWEKAMSNDEIKLTNYATKTGLAI